MANNKEGEDKGKIPKKYIKRIVYEELEKRDSLYRDVHELISEMRKKCKKKSKLYLNEDVSIDRKEKLEAELKLLKEYIDKLNQRVFEQGE